MKPNNVLLAFACATALQALPGGALAAAGGAAGVAPATSGQTLDVCLAEGNPPFSASRPEPGGIDLDVAAALAERLQRPLHVAWVEVPNRGGLDKALRGAFQAGRCTLFFGIPESAGAGAEPGEAGLGASEPYLSAGYVLVAARKGGVRTLEDARRAGRIGAVSATPADLFLFANGFARVPYAGNEALLEALSTNAVDAAVMWMPALARLADEGRTLWPEAVRVGQIADPGLRTDFVVAMRAEPEAAARIDAALQQMRAEGVLSAIARRHGLPAPN